MTGSGWVVGERGVLTAWHVVKEFEGPGGELQSRPGRAQGDEDWYDCIVRWSDPVLDVALLEVVDRRWRAPDCPCEFADVGDQPLKCNVVGFPESEARPRNDRDTEQAAGTLLPAGGIRSGRVRFDVAISTPKTAALWQGISGAVIQDGNRRLMAVVTDTHPSRQQRRLLATAIADIAADEGFKQAARDVGQEPRLATAANKETGDLWKSQRELDKRKLLADRQAAISVQLGRDQPPARLAAVYGLAELADDWDRAEEIRQRQNCIDLLCTRLRFPIKPFPGDNASPKKLNSWRANHEVRHAIIGQRGEGRVNFGGASFAGAEVELASARFNGGEVDLREARDWIHPPALPSGKRPGLLLPPEARDAA